MANSKQLEEVSFIRPIAIILLVFVHAMAPYTGAWNHIDGIDDVEAYKWFTHGVASFLLEPLTFISGYLFSYMIFVKKRNYTFLSLAKLKFHRLIIPSVIFSLCYSYFFLDIDLYSFNYWYNLICGYGHMWYLPMLFWCFIITYCLFKVKIKESYKIIFLFLVSIFSFLPLPFRLGNTIHFLFYFYVGTWCFVNKNIFIKFATKRNIIVGLFIYVICFSVLKTVTNYLLTIYYNNDFIFHKVLYLSAINLCKTFYIVIALLVLYLSSLYVTSNFKLNIYIVKFNSICYGIYILQQFILQFLYYHTSLPVIVDTYLLPWIAFLLTLISSILLSKVLLLTKIGRFLIG